MKMKATDTSNNEAILLGSIKRWKETLQNSYNRYRGKSVPDWIASERKGIRQKIQELQDKLKEK